MKNMLLHFTDAEFRKMKRARKYYDKEHNTRTNWRGFISNKCCKGLRKND